MLTTSEETIEEDNAEYMAVAAAAVQFDIPPYVIRRAANAGKVRSQPDGWQLLVHARDMAQLKERNARAAPLRQRPPIARPASPHHEGVSRSAWRA